MQPTINGKWQLAFWVMAVVCGVWLGGVTAGVVANEVRNVTEHQNIRREHNTEFNDFKACVQNKFEAIMIKLTRIEEQLETMKEGGH